VVGDKLILKRLIRVLPVVLIFLTAIVAKADMSSVISLDGRSDLYGKDLYGASIELGDLLQVSTSRGRTWDITITRSTLSTLGNRSLSGATGGNGTFVLIITADGQMQGSLVEGADFYTISSEDGSPLLVQRDSSALPRPIDEAVPAPLPHLFEPTEQSLEIKPTDIKTRSLNNKKERQNSVARGETIYPVYKADTVIDVLVYYDSKLSRPETTVDYLLEYSNLAYDRTGIALTLNLAGLIPVTISSSQDNTALLDLLTNREAPFTSADDDRATFNADLVHIVRVDKGETEESNCGLASYSVYQGFSYRDGSNGITEWNPADGYGRYCSDRTFTHEIGHNLGAAHQRGDDGNDGGGAYDYSFGAGRSAVFKTIMATYSRTDTIPVFSDPNSDCLGFPCGVSPEYSDSADNKRTLANTKFIVAGYEGRDFDYAALQELSVSSSCEDETPFRGIGIINSTQYAVEVMSVTFLRANGSNYYTRSFDEGEFVLDAGKSSARGYCREEDKQPFGSEIAEAFFTYKNPETAEEIEGTHIFFDNAYEGDYGIVRAAAGNGGSVVGNPSIHARVDSEVEITFKPDYGYKLAEVTGTCPGSLHYNVYTAEPIYGDCWAVARFEELNTSDKAMERVKSLFDSVMSVRGK